MMTKVKQVGWLLLLAVWMGCGDSYLTIMVHVTNLSGAQLQALQVIPSITRGSAPSSAWPVQAVYQNLTQFVLKLNVVAPGDLVVDVFGLDGNKCRVAEGISPTLSVGVASTTYETSVNLHPLMAGQQGCQIVVTGFGVGNGTIASDPVGNYTSNTSYVVHARFGATVNLTAIPSSDSYFGGWSGSCTGTAPCTVTSADSPVTVGAGFLQRAVCTEPQGFPRWCWENPLPQGSALLDVWALTPTDAWAVGENSTILHWNGSFWAPVPAGAPLDNKGEQVLVDLNSVWGSSSDDVWVVGLSGVILHWNGSAFSLIDSGTQNALLSVGGSASDDVWVVGENGTVLHYGGTGTLIQQINTLLTQQLSSLHANSKNDVWIVGSADKNGHGTILHFDGSSFSSIASCTEGYDYTSVWTSGTDIFVAGNFVTPDGANIIGVILHGKSIPKSGECWEPFTPIGGIFSLWGNSPTNVWAVGEYHAILHFDGSGWNYVVPPVTVGSDSSSYNLDAVSGSQSEDIWFISFTGKIEHWNGSFLNTATEGLATDLQLNAMWASAPDDVWAGGNSGALMHWNGTAWNFVDLSSTLMKQQNIWGLWGSGPTDVWAVGALGITARWNGTTWSDGDESAFLQTGSSFAAVWGSSQNDVWMAGNSGSLWHWDGKLLTQAQVPAGFTDDLNSLSGSAANDVWAVGGNSTKPNGSILYYDGNDWNLVTNSVMHVLNSVTSLGTRQMLTVGDGGTILQYQGMVSTPIQQGPTYDLYGVWGSSSNDLWIVGSNQIVGNIYHWDGNMTWSLTMSSVAANFASVYGLESSDVWVVGTSGTIMRHHLQ